MRAFKVGDKVTSEEFGDGVVLSNEFCPSGYPVCVEFSDGCAQDFTEEGLYWENGWFPYKNIKHKEAQGMNKSDLKTGMVVEYRDGCSRVVLADVGLLVGDDGWGVLENYNELLECKISRDYNIIKVYSQPRLVRHYLNTSLEHRKILWQREEVKEIPLNEAEVLLKAHLGYTVKVVGGE